MSTGSGLQHLVRHHSERGDEGWVHHGIWATTVRYPSPFTGQVAFGVSSIFGGTGSFFKPVFGTEAYWRSKSRSECPNHELGILEQIVLPFSTSIFSPEEEITLFSQVSMKRDISQLLHTSWLCSCGQAA